MLHNQSIIRKSEQEQYQRMQESDSEEELIGAVAQSVSKMSFNSKLSKKNYSLEEKCWYR